MLVYLENKFCKITFSTLGAEMVSFISKRDNSQRVWQGDEKIWNGQAPLLFPFIGRLKDKEYTHGGSTYQIASHGFARTTEFNIVSEREDEIVFSLENSDETKKLYPFDFKLEIRYTLKDNTLTKTHKTTNTGSEIMYYEVGGHDGFNVCTAENECMKDYYLDFGNIESFDTLCLDENLMLDKQPKKIEIPDGKLFLDMEVFKGDALVIHKPSFKSVRLRSIKSDKEVKVDFEDFDTIAFWTRYIDFDTNYICIEPWTTLPDCNFIGKELSEKIDIRKLEVGESEELTFTVTVI